eukprot:1067919_1
MCTCGVFLYCFLYLYCQGTNNKFGFFNWRRYSNSNSNDLRVAITESYLETKPFEHDRRYRLFYFGGEDNWKQRAENRNWSGIMCRKHSISDEDICTI